MPFFCPNPNCGMRGPFQAFSGPFVYFEISSHGAKFVPKRLADKVITKYRFATHRQSHVIWTYTNGVYEPVGEELIRAECRSELESLAKEGHVQEVVKHIQETTFTEPDKFDAPIGFINLKNGVYDLKTGELKPHSPDIIFTNELPIEYNEHVGCPDIMQFLSEVLLPEDVPLVQELIGYCLLRDYPFAKAFMCLGEGANGKSTLLRLMTKLLGEENVATPALADFFGIKYNPASGKFVPEIWESGDTDAIRHHCLSDIMLLSELHVRLISLLMEPATPAQLEYLRSLRIEVKPGLTKKEASKILDEAKRR